MGKEWNPSKYDADAWIDLMNRAGIKFFDFTTKHHEGFSMYDTETVVHDCWTFSDDGSEFTGVGPCGDDHRYSSAQSFGRDITGELVAAARRGCLHCHPAPPRRRCCAARQRAICCVRTAPWRRAPRGRAWR